MCEKSSACGCAGHSPGAVGSGAWWSPMVFLGACFSLAIIVTVVEHVWPWALAGAAVLGGWKARMVAYRAGAAVRRWQLRRRVARCIPAPDYAAVTGMRSRTVVEAVTVLPLAGGMRKTPGLNWAGRGRAGKAS